MDNKVDQNGQLKDQYESPYLIYFEHNEIGLQILKNYIEINIIFTCPSSIFLNLNN